MLVWIAFFSREQFGVIPLQPTIELQKVIPDASSGWKPLDK